MLDPDTMMRLAAWRADELQQEAARYRLASTFVPRWRRVAGGVLLRVGFKMLGARPAPALVLVHENAEC